jgi:hypothetical protein
MEASLQSALANSKMAYRHWSSVEYKTVGQSVRQSVSWSVSASQLDSMRVRAAERASETEMVS